MFKRKKTDSNMNIQTTIADMLPTPVVAIDREFKVFFINKAGADLAAKSQENCIGQKCYDIFKTRHCQTNECCCAQAMQHYKIFTTDTIASPQEIDIPIRYTGTPLFDKHNKFIGVLEYIVDISKETQITSDVINLVAAYKNGELNSRLSESKFEGNYHKIVQGINDMLNVITEPIINALNVFEKIVDRDLTVQMKGDYKGDYARLKESVNNAIKNLNETLEQVAIGADQVNSASSQISMSSQDLAHGASEQASNIEEVTSALKEMLSIVRETANNTIQTSELANETKGQAEEIRSAMEMVSNMVNQIKTSSDETAKIIKTIDGIAFQTNLLALNAAVEAARAGEAGKGFAVVAEEVRNLAIRSAEAARNTSVLIDKSKQTTETGVIMTEEMSSILSAVIDKVNKVAERVQMVSAVSEEQVIGFEEINKSVDQINSIIQKNAANSEESASVAEELSGQAEQLRSLVNVFNLENIDCVVEKQVVAHR